jgi:hypothetical protein
MPRRAIEMMRLAFATVPFQKDPISFPLDFAKDAVGGLSCRQAAHES